MMKTEGMKSASILGCRVDLINMQDALNYIKQLVQKGSETNLVVTLNAEIIYQTKKNEELRQVINQASLVTADGIGTVWGARTLGYHQEERVSGIDLLHSVCAQAAIQGWKIYLLGAAPGVALKAAQVLEQTYPGLIVCGCRDGYFAQSQESQIIDDINNLKPHILFAALGAPKQEIWLSRNSAKIKVPVCMGVGGSFDVIAGIKRRAPQLFIRLNMEWLYRLLSEPSRFKRQLALPAFVVEVLKQKYSRH